MGQCVSKATNADFFPKMILNQKSLVLVKMIAFIYIPLKREVCPNFLLEIIVGRCGLNSFCRGGGARKFNMLRSFQGDEGKSIRLKYAIQQWRKQDFSMERDVTS